MINNKKRTIIFYLLIAIVIVIPFISIGYSALATTLNIRGDVLSLHINERTETFPDPIETLLDNEPCMARYEGNVTDSVGVTDVAHNVYFNKCEDKRNIIFGGFCWQMIRTTETGGIKMVYNGEPENGKCESTRGAHKGIVGSSGMLQTIASEYLYGNTFTYNTTTNEFTLVDTTSATWSDSTYEDLLGKFTCKSASNTCTTLYQINSYVSNTVSYLSYYTISDTNYAQIGTSAFNANWDSPAMVGYMFNKVYITKSMSPGTTGYKYGSSFTYQNGTYTISGTTQNISNWNTGYNTINNTHYTCWNTEGTCTTISYIFSTTSTNAYYISLDEGKNINDAINEMLLNNNVNKYNSSIKGIIDNWYVQNLNAKTSLLEDAIYCNSRTILDYGGWNPNGGSLSGILKLKNHNYTTDLSCVNETDQFAVSNSKAKLTYPVGLLENEEKGNMGNSLVETGAGYWTFSPRSFNNNSPDLRFIFNDGASSNSYVQNSNGSRPVVSLKNGVEFSGGSGSETDPWIVDDSTTLYKVFENEAKTTNLAVEYTGAHHDSYTEEPSKKIYHWFAYNNSNGDAQAAEILEKNNVLFGGFCWQMFRTTDTGGVKMIYNGTPVNGKCTRTGTGQQIGTTYFNSISGYITKIGYMSNALYDDEVLLMPENKVVLNSSMTGSTNYYYGTGVTYDSSTNKYTLTGVTQNTWSNTYSSSAGLYTCRSSTLTSCTEVYYIVKGISDAIYHLRLKDGNMLNYYNTNLVIGDSYTYNNGTYTLNNTTTVSKSNWIDNYYLYGKKYTCGDSRTSCTDIKVIISTKIDNYYYYSPTQEYVYGNSFSYNSTTNKYTLTNTVKFWDYSLSENTSSLPTHHYTCWNNTGECETLSYIYYINSPRISYFKLTNGKSIVDLKNEALYGDGVNVNNSSVKTYIDNWYTNNLTYYTSYLEDTIFCNDRKPLREPSNLEPNGGPVYNELNLAGSEGLTCENETDQFAVSNNKAKLTYPVGLMTDTEVAIMRNDNFTKTGEFYWLITPRYYTFGSSGYLQAFVRTVWPGGYTGQGTVGSTEGVRPVISLKPGTEYSSGDGSKNNPFIVSVND